MTRLGKALLAGAALAALVGGAEAQFTPNGSFVPITVAISQLTGLGTGVATALALATNVTGGLVTNPGAWQSWSPTVTCTTQTGTTFTPTGTFYEGPGRVVHVQLKVTLSGFSACSGAMTTSLPVSLAAGVASETICFGRESGTTGVNGVIYSNAGTPTFSVNTSSSAGANWLATSASNVFDMKCIYQGAT